MKTKKKKFTVQDYYTEEVIIGGLSTTRALFIKEMLAAGHSMKGIDFYLFVRDQEQDRRLRAAERHMLEGIKEVSL